MRRGREAIFENFAYDVVRSEVWMQLGEKTRGTCEVKDSVTIYAFQGMNDAVNAGPVSKLLIDKEDDIGRKGGVNSVTCYQFKLLFPRLL
jgi:hypothetical protein